MRLRSPPVLQIRRLTIVKRWHTVARYGGRAATRFRIFIEWSHSDLDDGAAMAHLWACKSITVLLGEAAHGDATNGQAPAMRRTLSTLSMAALGVGGIIGAGIFILTGQAAAANAGPAISLSFILGAVACAFAGLCYAEMASAIPISGSAYTYAYATLGELIAWIIGWDLILEYAVGAATVAIGWSGYVVSFAKDFGLVLPARFVSSPLDFDAATHAWTLTGAVLNLPAAAVIILMTALLVAGVRETARFNGFLVAVKLVVIVLFVASTVSAFSTENWIAPANPQGAFIPPNAGPGVYGWSGLVRGAAVVFFAYIGFDAVST